MSKSRLFLGICSVGLDTNIDIDGINSSRAQPAVSTVTNHWMAESNLCRGCRYGSSDVPVPNGEVCFVTEKSILAKLS